MAEPTHPLLLAIDPLITRIGAAVVDPADLRTDDVPLQWDGEVVAGIRLTAERFRRFRGGRRTLRHSADQNPSAGLDGIIADLEAQFGIAAGRARPAR